MHSCGRRVALTGPTWHITCKNCKPIYSTRYSPLGPWGRYRLTVECRSSRSRPTKFWNHDSMLQNCRTGSLLDITYFRHSDSRKLDLQVVSQSAIDLPLYTLHDPWLSAIPHQFAAALTYRTRLHTRDLSLSHDRNLLYVFAVPVTDVEVEPTRQRTRPQLPDHDCDEIVGIAVSHVFADSCGAPRSANGNMDETRDANSTTMPECPCPVRVQVEELRCGTPGPRIYILQSLLVMALTMYSV